MGALGLGEVTVEMTRDHVRMPAALLGVERRPAQDLGDEVGHVARMLRVHVGEQRRENAILADLSIKAVHQPLDGGHRTYPLVQRRRRLER